MTLVVDISYREPSYESRNGARPNPYRWRYVVDAETVDRATRLAIVEFRRIETMSSVGWCREIVAIKVSLR